MNIFLRILNYGAFYLIWYLCLRSIGRSGMDIALFVTVVYFGIHFAFVSDCPRKEGLFMVCLTAFGIFNESVLSVAGVLTYADALYAGIAWWTILLWFCFSSTFWHAFSWLEPYPILASFLGAIVAPICYAALAKSGAVSFMIDAPYALFWIGIDWAIILPASFVFSRYWKERYLCSRK